MIQARKLRHSFSLLNPTLACICDRFVVGHFNAVYSPNKIGRLCGFVSTKSFRQVW